ncbi:MAG TPA: thioredoxin family protein [Thermoanaerobaculia bacterium]|nr:thioredoxin family protein [Thermoanaerobaculia bacterium]
MIRAALTLFALSVATASFAGPELSPGDKAPGFSLTDARSGKPVTFRPGDGKLSVVIFTCNTCPYSEAFDDRIVSLGRDYIAKGVAFYSINPNDDVKYPGESMEKMKALSSAKSYPFPYLKDGNSAVAGKYGARVTPHAFVVDAAGVIQYRGYVDDSAKPEEREHAGLSDALDAMIAKRKVVTSASKAFGCSIKWKKKA